MFKLTVDEVKALSIDDTAILVYQGGHHNIYCDGKNHYYTPGGFCHPSVDRKKIRAQEIFPCDCKYWKDRNKEIL